MASDNTAQSWNAAGYAAHAAFVPALGVPVLQLLNPQAGERILDLGCGDGVLTEKLLSLGATVVGVDSSLDMVAAACGKGIDAHCMDATQLQFDNEFDAVLSNAVLHWIKNDPDAPIAGVYRALKPSGRFVGEFGGFGNVAAISVALLAVLERRSVREANSVFPWFYPTVSDYRSRLERAGFHVESIELIPRPTPLPTGMRGWLETFANSFCGALPTADRESYLDEVTRLLEPVLCDEKGNWTADYCRLRFSARKTE